MGWCDNNTSWDQVNVGSAEIGTSLLMLLIFGIFISYDDSTDICIIPRFMIKVSKYDQAFSYGIQNYISIAFDISYEMYTQIISLNSMVWLHHPSRHYMYERKLC